MQGPTTCFPLHKEVLCISGNNFELDAHYRLIPLVHAIARYNAIVNARFPLHHPFSRVTGRCLSGSAWNLPLPLVIFLNAAETAGNVSIERRKSFARQLQRTIVAAQQKETRRPERDESGKIRYRETLPFAMPSLPEDIGLNVKAFFASVRALTGWTTDLERLKDYENSFWIRYQSVCLWQNKIKRDSEDLYHVLLALRRYIPGELCGKILCMVM